MNELIKVVSHETLVNAVNARDLHGALEIKKDFSDWIKAQIERADLSQGIDFVKFPQQGKAENKPLMQYALTIDAAKNIAMLSQTAKGKEVRAYFIECERKLKNTLPQTYLEALKALVEVETAKQQALDEVAKLNTIIDNELGYSSILRASLFLGIKETEFNWRVLKSHTQVLGMDVKRVPSPRFGYQVLYPLRAFRECYPQYDFDDLTPELIEDKEKLAIIKSGNYKLLA